MAVTGGRVYVSWQLSLPWRPGAPSELARIDPATGAVEARLRLRAAVGQEVTADGWLWVAATFATGPALLKVNGRSLAVAGRWRLRATQTGGWGRRALAAAAGGLWVADGDRLIRLSLPGAQVVRIVDLPGAASSDVSANAAGGPLVVGEAAEGGSGAVQLRDPETGAILASHPVLGVAAPLVAGPSGSSVWVSEATGMMGYVQRLDAATLAPGAGACRDGATTRDCVTGTNAITARLANGLVWITDPAGGPARNYCARPGAGRRLAPIRFPQPGGDELLAIGPRSVFYAAPSSSGASYLRQEPIPAACRAR